MNAPEIELGLSHVRLLLQEEEQKIRAASPSLVLDPVQYDSPAGGERCSPGSLIVVWSSVIEGLLLHFRS